MPRAILTAGLLSLSFSLVACGTPGTDDDDIPTPPQQEGVFLYSDTATVCESPAGALPEFSEESQARGLELIQPEERGDDEGGGAPLFGSGLADIALVAHDIDADGDIDVVAAEARPSLYLNDGNGYFTHKQVGPMSQDGIPVHLAAVDIDGDRLPELIGSYRPTDPTGEHGLVIWPNLGGADFGIPTFVSSGHSGMYGDSSTLAFGDINGDGWIDVHHGKRHQVPETMGTYPEQIFLGSAEGFSAANILEFSAYSEPSGVATLISTFTDRDGDGDQDLFVLGGSPDYMTPAPGCAFFRNDGNVSGSPVLINDGPEIGVGSFFSAMGLDSADLNGDGTLDYCATDVGPIRCYLSAGNETWFEASVTDLGLLPDDPVYEFPATIGWSIDLRDVNNDGLLDVLQASAPDHGGIWAGGDPFPDLLWLGQPDGTFSDVTAETTVGSTHNHIGMVTADFNSDGALDVLFHAEDNDDIPRLYMNRCTEGHWTNIELVGPPENTEGYGARVEFNYGGVHQIREVYALRATAQGPSRVHQGLGTSESFDLTVKWPDGTTSQAIELPADRLVTVVHPDAPESLGDDDDSGGTQDDDDSATVLATLQGNISRSVLPTLDGIGDIYMSISNPLLGAGPAGIVAQANLLGVDLSSEGSIYSYEIGHVPVTATPLTIELFLDDDGSGATGGASPGDLGLSSFPEVLFDTDAGASLDIVLDLIVQ